MAMRYPYLVIDVFYFLFLLTIASITATAVIFTMSRTELSKSVKWIGLFRPIWIGPMNSGQSSDMVCNSR